MALRSSPRLQAMSRLCCDPSGKQAVFVPRVTKVTSTKTVRNEGERNLISKRRDVQRSGPTLKRPREVVSEALPVSGNLRKKGNNVTKNVRFSQTCTLRESSTAEVSKAKIQKDLKGVSDKSQSIKTQTDLKAASPSKKASIIRGNATGSEETSDAIKQQNDKRFRTSTSPTTSFQSSTSSGHDPKLVTGSATTTLNVKRKRGRPPKHTANGCKRIKIGSNGSFSGSPSDDNALIPVSKCEQGRNGNSNGSPSYDSTLLPRSKISEQVIDLTCEDETITDEVDAALFVPCSSTNPNLTQSEILPKSGLSKLSYSLEDDYPSTVQGASAGIDTTTEDSSCTGTSLHSGESVAQLFDLTSKHDLKEDDCRFSNEVLTVPSLKRSREILVPLAREKTLSLERVSSNDCDEATEAMSSLTEEEYPQPSTPQQKLMRRLARQKQLEEMRAKETALLREERLLRQKGILPKSTAAQSRGSTKRISWKDETDLVELFVYSPVHDDDEDTVSVHSDDPNAGMEVTDPVCQ